jgi:hypothetical protein
MSGVITDEEIRETFYNLMLEVAIIRDLKNALQSEVTRSATIQSMIIGAIQTICEMSSVNGFPTMRGHLITSINVSPTYREMFAQLGQIRQIPNQERRNEAITQLVRVVIQKDSFKSIIKDLVRFYLESAQEKNQEVTIDTIRQTFYNLMVDEVFSSGDVNAEGRSPLIRKEHLIDQDAFIFFALSGLTILSSVKSSLDNKGIWLQNGAIVTELNCPPSYQPLFKHLIQIKQKYKSLGVTPNQFQLIKICVVNDPDLVIPDQLKILQTPQLMSLVSTITDLAINISAIAHFKEVLNDVIKYCIDAFGQ